ncbi:MAG: DUF2318 domain-containing protein [Candidatus Altiarchaeota archaeon]|nr:DUF2318 domain-containing protein [Candidatus Altiarchaeota archaeon]
MKKYAITIGVLLGLVALYSLNSPASADPAELEQDFMKIPISEISNNIKKNSFDTNGIEVRFFVVRAPDGEIRTAFDACDVCGGHRGYSQQGDMVVCNNCGLKFSINDLGTKNRGGGCWPSFLKHKIEGDYILIDKNELAQSTARFA